MPAPVVPNPVPVPPAYKTCRLSDIASFQPGVWNGKPHDAAFIQQLFANFQKYSTGPKPYYRPYVSINHDDELRGGHVAAARFGAGAVLRLDAEDIPEPVGAWRNAGGLTDPSIEYFEPVYNDAGELVDGFRKPDGTIEPGPVLKCLTLLGNEAPASKGLGQLPFATFAQKHVKHPAEGGRVLKFSNSNQGATMDRAAMLAALQAAGVDITPITDATPDEVLKAWLASLQAKAVPDALPADATQQMADAFAGLGAAAAVPTPAPAAAPANLLGGLPQPTKAVLQFKDNTPAGIAAGVNDFRAQIQAEFAGMVAAEAAKVTQQMAAVNRQAAQQAHAAKFNDVTAFVNSLAKPDGKGKVRITPSQKAGLVGLLLKCDSVRVRKFADGKAQGSELEEMKAYQLATLPFLTFAEKMPDGTGGDATPGTGNRGAGGMDPDRRARMLGATPQGRAILARDAAAARTAAGARA